MPERRIGLALVFCVVAGCASLSDYQRPELALPAQWTGAGPLPTGAAITERWWTLFSDATLDRLVAEALAHNTDLAVAVARVDEARALVDVSAAELWPSVDATVLRSRTRFSESTDTPLPPGTPVTSTVNRAALNVSYELDLFGRLRNATAAARAQLLATQAAQETVRIGLTADVVSGYYGLIALDSQVAATRRSLELRERDLALQRIRYKAGLIGDFELRQREAEVAAARAQLPALERDRSTQELALALLLGRAPRALLEENVARTDENETSPPVVVPEGMPSELLLRRPDLLQAEQQLVAANAQLAAARAAFFPRIPLTGFIGSESASLSDLFTGPARIWTVGAAAIQPIFQGGRLRGERDAAQAREQQALAQYRAAVQSAFLEVRQAVITQDRAREIYEAEGERMSALTDTLRLARVRYDNGLASQLEVLDAERNLLQAELNRIAALRDRRIAVVDLIRALGGGWSSERPFATTTGSTR
jgi:multidrug efflux system outer membrane protein